MTFLVGRVIKPFLLSAMAHTRFLREKTKAKKKVTTDLFTMYNIDSGLDVRK